MENVQPTPASEQAVTTEPSIEDKAAHDYDQLIPMFYNKIEELSNRSLKRVVQALVEYPLKGVNYRFSYLKEREAFFIGMRLFDCKTALLNAVMNLSQEEKQKILSETAEQSPVKGAVEIPVTETAKENADG
jgi:hypothetical protein